MAVYTKLRKEDIKKIKDKYDLNNDIEFIEIPDGIMNTTYLIKGKNKKHIFRLLEGERNINEELKELEFLNFLNKEGIQCPEICLTNEGENHIFIQEKMGALFTFIEGEKVEIINEEILEKIGSTLGRMHKASQGKSIIRERKIELDYFYKKIVKTDLREILDSNYNLIIENYNRVKNIDFSGLPRGIIHNDIFPDNVFIGENLSLIDFNDCMEGPFIVDISIVINFWIRNKKFDKIKEKKLIKEFIKGYEKERKLEPKEKKLLEEMLIKVALTFIFLRVNKFHVEDNSKSNMEFKNYKDLLFLLEEEISELY